MEGKEMKTDLYDKLIVEIQALKAKEQARKETMHEVLKILDNDIANGLQEDNLAKSSIASMYRGIIQDPKGWLKKRKESIAERGYPGYK